MKVHGIEKRSNGQPTVSNTIHTNTTASRVSIKRQGSSIRGEITFGILGSYTALNSYTTVMAEVEERVLAKNEL